MRPLKFIVRHRVDQHPASFDDGVQRFDVDLATRLVGKRVLIGIRYEDFRGQLKREERRVGTVRSVDPLMGIVISLEANHAGGTLNLPPDTRSFQAAAKGVYELRPSGEVVVDPDFISQWWRFLARDA
jgi:hypothetical protein